MRGGEGNWELQLLVPVDRPAGGGLELIWIGCSLGNITERRPWIMEHARQTDMFLIDDYPALPITESIGYRAPIGAEVETLDGQQGAQ